MYLCICMWGVCQGVVGVGRWLVKGGGERFILGVCFQLGVVVGVVGSQWL